MPDVRTMANARMEHVCVCGAGMENTAPWRDVSTSAVTMEGK